MLETHHPSPFENVKRTPPERSTPKIKAQPADAAVRQRTEDVDKADIAIAIAGISALFTGLGLLYTRRLAINDTRRMKRKGLAIEPWVARKRIDDGGRHVRISVRNLEPYSAHLTRIHVGRNSSRFRLDPQRMPNAEGDNLGRERNISVRIPPGPTKEVAIYLLTAGDIDPRELRVDWHWVDGTKR